MNIYVLKLLPIDNKTTFISQLYSANQYYPLGKSDD